MESVIAMVSYSWLAFCLHIVSMSSQKQIPGQGQKSKIFIGEEKPAKDNRREWEQAESSFKRRCRAPPEEGTTEDKDGGLGAPVGLGCASDSWYWLRS